jgi:hypothetical protein
MILMGGFVPSPTSCLSDGAAGALYGCPTRHEASPSRAVAEGDPKVMRLSNINCVLLANTSVSCGIEPYRRPQSCNWVIQSMQVSFWSQSLSPFAGPADLPMAMGGGMVTTAMVLVATTGPATQPQATTPTKGVVVWPEQQPQPLRRPFAQGSWLCTTTMEAAELVW